MPCITFLRVFCIMEIWKPIKGFEGIYEVSNYGNVKSLNRIDRIGRRKKGIKLKLIIDSDGYYRVNLYNYSVSNKNTHAQVHVLVAIAFLGHKSCGYELVVNHKDFDRLNNFIDNLEIITTRKNTDLKHIPSSSKYVGVHFHKRSGKWVSRIVIKRKRVHLGVFTNEYDAHLAYQKALSEI